MLPRRTLFALAALVASATAASAYQSIMSRPYNSLTTPEERVEYIRGVLGWQWSEGCTRPEQAPTVCSEYQLWKSRIRPADDKKSR